MSFVTDDVARLLHDVRRSGGFCTSGVVETLAPGLEVDGVGPVALPLLTTQAEQLVAVAERAPYGRGERTLHDTTVRRTWQIETSRVRFAGRGWARTLDGIVARVSEGLGVDGAIEAEFYKLLLYEEGSFFVTHRDSEKREGMFATLVVALPSLCGGGELLVSHAGSEARLDLSVGDPADVAYAAFYADCPHEVLPVTSGYRLSLVYNLWRPAAGPRLAPPDHGDAQDALSSRLRQWAARPQRDEDPAEPEKLVYPLEHSYTQAGLSFAMLKGQDAARAATLVAAAEAAECDTHLALLSIEEWGAAEDTGGDYWSRDDKAEDYEPVGDIEKHCELTDWRRPDDGEAALGPLPFDEDEVTPFGALDDIAPDEESFHEATGNEGASFERSYRRTALVLWPRKRRLAVLNQGGLAVTQPLLASLAGRWVAGGCDPGSPLRADAHELAGHMLATWPGYPWLSHDLHGEVSALLATLGRLGDTVRIEAFLGQLSLGRAYGLADNDAILAGLTHLAPDAARATVARIVADNALPVPAACADLLARAGEAALAPRIAAETLLAAVLQETTPDMQIALWRRRERKDPQFVADFLNALGRVDAALAEAGLDDLLARPEIYAMDAMLVPAVITLSEIPPDRSAADAVAARLAMAVRGHLRARIALPLAPPTDWTRDASLACDCRDCRALGRFLADPAQAKWHFKAKKADRDHVTSTVRNDRCDLDLATLRTGSPHILLCTKNQKSYVRRTRQRKDDLANLARIEARWPAPPSG